MTTHVCETQILILVFNFDTWWFWSKYVLKEDIEILALNEQELMATFNEINALIKANRKF